MPTGYTAYIEKGEINTGRDFLLKCARGFGACMSMRDESLSVDIPVKLEPSTYHKEQLEKAYTDLEKYKKMTLEEAQIIVDEEYKKNQVCAKQSLEKYRVTRDRYDKVRAEIDNWNPPTSEHVNLKNFALDQIKISTEFDSEKYYIEDLNKPKKSAEQYISDKIISATENIQYHLKNWNEEVQSANEKNKWIQDLRESLK